MDYYEILGVEKNASQDEIKKAFRQKARQLHPDVNKAPDAEEKFKELGKAYETLSDSSKREVYDRYGEDGLKNAGYTSGPFDFGFGDLGDIFAQFFGEGGFGFGGGYSRRNPNAPQRGNDLRLDIQIDFMDAVFGVEKEIKIDHLVECEECHGTGLDKDAKETTCTACHGTGQVQQSVRTPLGSFTSVTTCPTCHGTGKNPGACCKKCKGAGAVEQEKTISLKIPHGVDNGSKIRVSHEGDAGKNGGENGDLYVVIYVKESDIFERVGNDVYSGIKISLPQAVLGDKVVIQTLDGEREISVPKGVQPGEKLCLKGLGVPVLGVNNRRGDYYVTINIEVPKKLNQEEENLYKKLFDISKNTQKGIMDKIKSSFAGK